MIDQPSVPIVTIYDIPIFIVKGMSQSEEQNNYSSRKCWSATDGDYLRFDIEDAYFDSHSTRWIFIVVDYLCGNDSYFGNFKINYRTIDVQPRIINNKFVYIYEWYITDRVSGIYLYTVNSEKRNEKPVKHTGKFKVIK